jgi:hypothetical protein
MATRFHVESSPTEG